MQWIYVLCILAAGAIAEDSFERVRRAPGKRCPRIQNFPGKVKYKRRGTRAQFRCYKTFSRYGPRFVSCRSDNTWSGEPPLCIKAGCVPIDIQHLIKLDMTESYGGALLSFKCEDNYQLIGPTEISCDSKVWSATPPVCKAPIQLKECDFEFDLCGWTQDDSDELNWERTQGQTSTGGTGPKTDHTFQDLSGHYMFVESSNPARNGDQARLLSPVYPADMGDMCFEFWYHILGPDDPGHVGTLEVYVRGDSEFIDDLQPLFIKSGNQGDVWKRGDIYIDKRDEPFQIVIVTTRKLSYISDIAIDDVRLYNCSGTTTSTTTTSTTTSTTTTPSSTSTSTISSTVTSATLSTSIPPGLPRSATASTSANVSSSTVTPSTGTTSLLTTAPKISPSSTVSVFTPSKPSSQDTTTVPVSSESGNMTSAVTTTITSKYLSKGIASISPSTSLLEDSSTVAASSVITTEKSSARSKSSIPFSTTLGSAFVTTKSSTLAASSITTTTEMSSTRSKSSSPISTSPGSASVTTSSSLTDKVSTSMPVTMETKPASKLSPTTTTQLPVTSSTAVTSSSTPAPSRSTSTPKPSTSSTLTHSTVPTVKPTSFSVPSTTTTTEKLVPTSAMKTSTTSSQVQTKTSSTKSKPTSTTVLKVGSTVARTTPTSTKISTKETTSQPTTSTTSTPISISLSTFTKLKTTLATTVKSSSAKPTLRMTKRTVITPKQTTTGALLNKTMPKSSTPPVKLNKTVSTESKVTTVDSNDTEPVVVAQSRSQHPADETLRPLMIGLGVGIVAGLIIIGVVAWVCVRRRKFYTSRYEDELKPITKSSSNENFNNIQYEYHDDEEYQ